MSREENWSSTPFIIAPQAGKLVGSGGGLGAVGIKNVAQGDYWKGLKLKKFKFYQKVFDVGLGK